LIRLVFLFFLSFGICCFDANAQFHTTHNLDLVNCVKNRSYFAIPVTLIAAGSILSNSKFKINVQKYVVGNSKTKLDNYLQIAPAGITIGLETLGIKGEHKPLQTAIIFSISNVILNSIVHPLKRITKVKRPDNSDFNSFPSGHTTEAFASAELMRIEFRESNPLLSYAGYLMAGATGYLRMYNNKHWISDVIAAAGIGIGSTKLALMVFDKIEDHRRFKKYIKGNSILIPSYQQNQFCINWIKRF
jgi:membrane-associated phospholipid phosphatase